jgi:hypothetical protein
VSVLELIERTWDLIARIAHPLESSAKRRLEPVMRQVSAALWLTLRLVENILNDGFEAQTEGCDPIPFPRRLQRRVDLRVQDLKSAHK